MDPSLLADDPIQDATEDLLGRGEFAKQIVSVLHSARAEKSSTVLALIGPWGSGKSSVLKLVEATLHAHRLDWSVTRFNPWEFTDLQTLAFAFFAELSTVIRDDFQDETLFETFRAYSSKLLSFGGAVTSSPLMDLIGINPGKIAESAAKLLASKNSVSDLRDRLEKALRDRQRGTLVILDDIDRLAPSELLLVFKLVRLLGRLPNICYLLAYDEHTLLSVLQETELARNNRGRALAYLEKIVQVRMDLPIVHELQARDMIDACLAALNLPPATSEASVRLTVLFNSSVFAKLTEPRSIKRFFAQVRAYLPLVIGEVDVADFISLTYLRTYHPGVHRSLYRLKSELLPPVEKLFQLVSANSFLIDNGVCDKEEAAQVAPVLQELFPRFRMNLALHGAYNPAQPEMLSAIYTPDEKSLTLARRAASPECFDRYFYFGVPPRGFSDTRLAAQARNLGAPKNAEAEAGILEQLRARFDITASRLALMAGTLEPMTCARLLNLMARAYREASLHTDDVTGVELHRHGARLMARLDDVSARVIYKSPTAPADVDFLLLSAHDLWNALASQEEWAGGDQVRTMLERWLVPKLVASMPNRLEPLLQSTLTWVDWSIPLLLCWGLCGQQRAVREWLEQNLDSERSRWKLEDLIALCVSDDPSRTDRLLRTLSLLLPASFRYRIDALVDPELSAVNMRDKHPDLGSFSSRVTWGAEVLKRVFELIHSHPR